MKLAAIQLDTIACEVNLNVHKAMKWGRRAFEEGAEMIFFHEGLTADYSPNPMRDGRSLDSSEVFGFSTLAKRYKGYIALGLNEVFQGRPYISTVFLGSKGVIDVYRKSYLWPNWPESELLTYLQNYVPYKEGYRLERSVIAPGDGTKVTEVNGLRIGCIICADGSRPEAWETFKKDKPDLIFWQNNRGNVIKRGDAQEHAKELDTPMIVTNRCGFSYHHFQEGGTCMIANDGTVVVQANENGEEEIIYASLEDLQV
ncbi:MAG: carbon-nitrogen hydrolase family protein [Candidatus Latescibacteria bacterium]|nr:carbon-nitrogen hydrolase family protein [Candidatus Latescibacterota bacterium]